MSRLRDHKRQMRAALHREMSVAALYFVTPTAAGVPCTVRAWLKTENQMVGDLQGFPGAERAEPEDRLRFDLSEFNPSALPRRIGVVRIVEDVEAYRLDHGYPADLGWQTWRVIPLEAEEAATYPVPAP